MAAGLAGLMKSYGPQIKSLQEQLQGLLPERSGAPEPKQAASGAPWLEQVTGYLPLIMQAGEVAGRLFRPKAEAQAGERPRDTGRGRDRKVRKSHWKRYVAAGLLGGVVITVAVMALREGQARQARS